MKTDIETSESQRSFASEFIRQVRISVVATMVLALIVSWLYPAIVFVIAQLAFPGKANGSLITRDGTPASKDADAVGSTLIGQSFSAPQYFHGRPSAAGNGYDATASGGSNLGPTSAKLMCGTVKNNAYTIFATSEKGRGAVVDVAGRVQGVGTAVTKTSITLAADATPTARKTTYALDATVADPNAVVNYHGRTVHATTIPAGSIVELKLNDKKPPAVVGINVVDSEIDGAPASIDTTANKITMSDAGATVINFDPKSTVFVVNGKIAPAADVMIRMAIHAVVASVEDNDGIADRVIHYCQDNSIAYTSSVADSAFTDADGVDDVKLINAFNAATMPTITPKDAKQAIPPDAVTASGSGLDPHISRANADMQAARVAGTRKVSAEKVTALIEQCTDEASLGFLGESGVNVLRLNLALDKQYPMPAAKP